MNVIFLPVTVKPSSFLPLALSVSLNALTQLSMLFLIFWINLMFGNPLVSTTSSPLTTLTGRVNEMKPHPIDTSPVFGVAPGVYSIEGAASFGTPSGSGNQPT